MMRGYRFAQWCPIRWGTVLRNGAQWSPDLELARPKLEFARPELDLELAHPELELAHPELELRAL